MRAGRVKPATTSWPKNNGQRGRERFLINTHKREEHVAWQPDEPANNFFEEAIHGVQRAFPSRRARSVKRVSSAAQGSRLSRRRATRSKSPLGGSSCWCKRKSARNRRLARLRWTAFPTAAREATTPTRSRRLSLSCGLPDDVRGCERADAAARPSRVLRTLLAEPSSIPSGA